ncbi:hypothetical protein VR44_29165 [Streptomyces katrae]|uniref:Uncharacterized protein n=1 Tax=Streptomyces katrae TaxID=68223 RepID=A0A0F4IXQ5_9ACTN|nr:hypothetical protein VR44_29165 [Streptomyces katrae]
MQSVDQAAGRAGSFDQFLSRDAEFGPAPFGMDEPGPADHPALRRRGGNPASVSTRAAIEVDVAEGQCQWASLSLSLLMLTATT